MIKLQKTSSFALLFSVAIHVIVFSILYINFSKTKTADVYPDKIVFHTSSNSELSDKVINDKTSTISTVKIIEEDQQKRSSSTGSLEVLETKYESTPFKENTVEANKRIEAKAVSAETALDVEQSVQNKTALNQDKETTLITGVNDTGLIPTDLPERTEGVNKSESVLKMELEEVNAELSAAINEVKERNQKKINQQRQQQIYVSED